MQKMNDNKTKDNNKTKLKDKVGSISLLLAYLLAFVILLPGLLLILFEQLGLKEISASLIAMQLSVILFALSLFKFKIKEMLSLFVIKVRKIEILAIILGFLLTLIVNVSIGAINSLLGAESVPGTADEIIKTNSIIVAVIFPIIFAPIFEELAFRAGFKKILIDKGGISPLLYIIISGVIFGLLHITPGQELVAFAITGAIGVINAVFYLRTNNIYVPILIHMTYNLFILAVAL